MEAGPKAARRGGRGAAPEGRQRRARSEPPAAAQLPGPGAARLRGFLRFLGQLLLVVGLLAAAAVHRQRLDPLEALLRKGPPLFREAAGAATGAASAASAAVAAPGTASALAGGGPAIAQAQQSESEPAETHLLGLVLPWAGPVPASVGYLCRTLAPSAGFAELLIVVEVEAEAAAAGEVPASSVPFACREAPNVQVLELEPDGIARLHAEKLATCIRRSIMYIDMYRSVYT